MKEKPTEPQEQAIDSLLRDFGIRPNEETRDKIRATLEKEQSKYLALERLRGKDRSRDISR
jgi:hypothetical protein